MSCHIGQIPKVYMCLDDDEEASITEEQLTWMPAHGGQATIGRVLKSDGSTLTPVDWRANRLVDVLAKSAARANRVGKDTLEYLDVASQALEFSLAKLAVVTQAANNVKVNTVLRDGTVASFTARDSEAQRPHTRTGSGSAKKRKRRYDAAPEAPSNALEVSLVSCSESNCTKKRRRLLDKESLEELRFREHWRANRPTLRPAEPGAAQNRLANLRERVLNRVKEADAWTW